MKMTGKFMKFKGDGRANLYHITRGNVDVYFVNEVDTKHFIGTISISHYEEEFAPHVVPFDEDRLNNYILNSAISDYEFIVYQENKKVIECFASSGDFEPTYHDILLHIDYPHKRALKDTDGIIWIVLAVNGTLIKHCLSTMGIADVTSDTVLRKAADSILIKSARS